MYVMEFCQTSGVAYFDIFSKLIDEEGLTIDDLYDEDKVHLSSKAAPLVEPLLLEAVGEKFEDHIIHSRS